MSFLSRRYTVFLPSCQIIPVLDLLEIQVTIILTILFDVFTALMLQKKPVALEGWLITVKVGTVRPGFTPSMEAHI